MELTQEQKFMYGLLDEFRAFVIDSMADNMHEDFDDHLTFIKASLESFTDQYKERGMERI
jgi:hypothetical protein